jgi:broad specificity phosphatase PhoE
VTHIFLVRHAMTVWHAEGRYAGSSDVALAPEGYVQADQLADWASKSELAAVWCSPLRRARLTAAPSARAMGVESQIDERLREVDFGLVEGKTLAEAEQLYPEAMRRFQNDPGTYAMPGGEDPRRAASRGVSALRDIVAAYPKGRILVVAHKTIIRLALCSVLGIPLHRYRSVFPVVNNATLTEIRFRCRDVGLMQYNSPLALLPKCTSPNQTS